MASIFTLVSLAGYIFFERSVKSSLGDTSLDWTQVTENDRHGHEHIVAITYLVLFSLFLLPINILYRSERYAVAGILYRILFTGLSTRVYFCDIILADILTSFSRVVGDLQIIATDIVYAPSDAHKSHHKMGVSLSEFIVPVLILIPYLVRLRQCVAEYSQSRDYGVRNRHFTNALKYISSMPVFKLVFNSIGDTVLICLSLAQTHVRI
jgi:hypothetical protein